MSIVLELFAFLRARKKLWLIPIATLMLLFGALLLIAESSAIAPFIYSLF